MIKAFTTVQSVYGLKGPLLMCLYLVEYDRWWAPMVDEIVIDKNRSKKKETANSSVKNSEVSLRHTCSFVT